MENRQLSLLARLNSPSAAPMNLVRSCASYRDAVRMSWQLRRVREMSRATAAHLAGFPAQHLSDYLALDDKPGRRNLQADDIKAWEHEVVGNTLVSQWLAWQSSLTVLEEMQASARIAA